ncbi:S46 family peptidase [Shewanella inventionis]|nr:S46 family peptidase [Shewanella inventionis]
MRIALVAALVLTSCFALADEGQWQPYQMLSIADKLQQRGIDIPASQLADLGQYPMNAVVSLGYCTASFVSPQGLVVTNHHCAYRGIQYNSKKDHNYLANGFLANTQAEEPSAGPNERLYITEEVTDVTDQVMANLSDDPLTRFENIQANSKALVKACEVDSNYRCEVDSFHHGLEYYLTKKLIIRDVRLVYAPPETIGGFGGDIDNYEYPRHSGDFTFLRAYVGKDGKPATYSKDNVPYQPKSYLTINADGVKAGDGIFVAGYPGSTSRYNLTSELQFASDWMYPTFAKRYQLQIDTITFMGAVDKSIALKYAGTLASMSNRMKKYNGLLDGFNATDIVGIKQQRENDFLAWLKQDPNANQNIISDLEALIAEQHQQMQTHYYYKNALSSELLNAASKLYRLAQERKKPNDQREPGYQLRDMKMFKAELRRISSRFDPAVDKTLWLQDLQAYVRQPNKNEVFDKALSITDNFEALEAKVEALYALTELKSQSKRVAWMTKKAIDFETSEDPFIRLAVAIHDTNMALEKSEKILEGKLSSARPEYMKAIIDYYKSNNWPVYPDANRTLRITYGMVDGYLSKDAIYKQPFTRLEGLAAKHTGKEPYNVPTKLLNAIKSDDLGKHRVASVYRDFNNCQFMSCLDKPADFNSVPVNFLSSADTTGGNSGSPVLNGKGELVGLNFDSTYEAITKDWFFNPTITRAVHVDIRYILWMMDKVDHADNLIKELQLDDKSHSMPTSTESAGSETKLNEPTGLAPESNTDAVLESTENATGDALETPLNSEELEVPQKVLEIEAEAKSLNTESHSDTQDIIDEDVIDEPANTTESENPLPTEAELPSAALLDSSVDTKQQPLNTTPAETLLNNDEYTSDNTEDVTDKATNEALSPTSAQASQAAENATTPANVEPKPASKQLPSEPVASEPVASEPLESAVAEDNLTNISKSVPETENVTDKATNEALNPTSPQASQATEHATTPANVEPKNAAPQTVSETPLNEPLETTVAEDNLTNISKPVPETENVTDKATNEALSPTSAQASQAAENATTPANVEPQNAAPQTVNETPLNESLESAVAEDNLTNNSKPVPETEDATVTGKVTNEVINPTSPQATVPKAVTDANDALKQELKTVTDPKEEDTPQAVVDQTE